MNHIKALQQKVNGLEAEVKALRDCLDDLNIYVQSAKFASGDRLDGYVSTTDIVHRVREAQSYATNKREEAEANFLLRPVYVVKSGHGAVSGAKVAILKENDLSLSVEILEDHRPYRKGDKLNVQKYDLTPA